MATKPIAGPVLLGLAAFIACVRVLSYDEPLERDLTTYAVIAHEMLQGRDLYSDLWDHKPPLIHLTYATAQVVAGYGSLTVYLLGLGSAVVTLLGVYFAGAALRSNTGDGLWAAAFWAVVCSNVGLQANQPNSEAFVNACLACAFALWVRDDVRMRQSVRFVIVGVLLALATLYKNTAIAAAFFLAVAHLSFPPGGEPRKRALRPVGIVAGVGALVWFTVCGYFAAQGRFQPFYDAVFAYNLSYTGGAPSIWDALVRSLWYPYFLKFFLPLILAFLAGAAAGLIRGPRRPWALFVAFGVGAQMAVALHGRLDQHYFQVWLPPLAISGGWVIGCLTESTRRRTRWCVWAGALAILAALFGRDFRYHLLGPQMLTKMKYLEGTLFVESRELGEGLEGLLADGETFYEWGNETGIYYASRRRPPTGVIYNWPLLKGPLAAKLSARVVADLERERPELLILPPKYVRAHRVFEEIRPGYVALPVNPKWGSFMLLARRDGNLLRRLQDAAKNEIPHE